MLGCHCLRLRVRVRFESFFVVLNLVLLCVVVDGGADVWCKVGGQYFIFLGFIGSGSLVQPFHLRVRLGEWRFVFHWELLRGRHVLGILASDASGTGPVSGSGPRGLGKVADV